MGELNVPTLRADEKFLLRNLKSIQRNFKATKGNEIHKAVLFSVYLVATKKINEAESFLESFINDIKPVEGNTNIWGSVAPGILLLAYLYYKKGCYEEEKYLVNKVRKYDYLSDNKSRSDFLVEDLAQHEETIVYAKSETQKYACEIIAYEILKFIDYYEMWAVYEGEVHPSEKEIIQKIIEDCYQQLRDQIDR